MVLTLVFEFIFQPRPATLFKECYFTFQFQTYPHKQGVVLPLKMGVLCRNLFVIKPWNVLVVDDHKLICDSIAALIEKCDLVDKVYAAYSAVDAIGIVRSSSIQMMLVDARMPGMSGVDLMRSLQKSYPSLKFVAMTSFDETATLKELLTLKPNGILLKQSTGASDIHNCIAQIRLGQTYYSADALSRLRNIDPLNFPTLSFGKREREILVLLSQGKVTKEIAEDLNLSAATVEDYRKELLKKTATKNTPELMVYLHRNGVL